MRRNRTNRTNRTSRNRLEFVFHRDYDVSVDDPGVQLIFLRVFAPTRDIFPDHRVLLLRKEFRKGDESPCAVYTGRPAVDAVRLDDLDPTDLFFALTRAKEELLELQYAATKKPWYKDREVLTAPFEIPEEVRRMVGNMPNLPDDELIEVEEELAPLFLSPFTAL